MWSHYTTLLAVRRQLMQQHKKGGGGNHCIQKPAHSTVSIHTELQMQPLTMNLSSTLQIQVIINGQTFSRKSTASAWLSLEERVWSSSVKTRLGSWKLPLKYRGTLNDEGSKFSSGSSWIAAQRGNGVNTGKSNSCIEIVSSRYRELSFVLYFQKQSTFTFSLRSCIIL